MRRLIGLLVLVPALLAAAPAAAQRLDPPEVEAPEVEVPDVGVPEAGLPDVDLPGGTADGLPGGDEEDGERQTQAAPAPFGHTCQEQAGVLFCPTRSLADRVPSFDDTPLDVDVTLPLGTEAGEPLPTIVIMHGYGGNKADFESGDPDGKRAEDDRDFEYNNNFYAKRGYAVVNYTARGFGRSCGKEQNSAATPECLGSPAGSHRSYLHLVDQRWEIRDTQYLLGELADQQVTEPKQIGVTGISYGGGQSVTLAFLKDHIRTGALAGEDDELEPWQSEDGQDMEIAAAFPRWPWSDLVASLIPNGRFLDDDDSTHDKSRDPLGVPIQSYINLFFALGAQSGTYCGTSPRPTPDPVPPGESGPPPDLFAPCQDFTSDLTEWKNRIEVGEPYEGEERAEAIAEEIAENHSGFGFPRKEGGDPAALLLQSGWTDDLFPPSESLRVYNELDGEDGETPVSLQFGDVGHPRASNKERTDQDFNHQGAEFFDEHVKEDEDANPPEPGSVSAYTQTCPAPAETDGPFEASSWTAIHPATVSFGDEDPQVVTSQTNDPFGPFIDPISSLQDPCRQGPDVESAGTAVYRDEGAAPAAPGEGYTMIGRPEVRATIASTPPVGVQGQLDSRLWDVGPTGVQTLVSRGAYRLTEGQSGSITFQLNGNGWCFAPGHTPKLELLGRDAPYLRASNGAFGVTVTDLTVDLPTDDEPCTTAPPTVGGGGDGSGGDDGSGSGGGGGGGNGGGGGSGSGGSGGDSDAPPAGIPPAPPSTVACLVVRLGGPDADSMFGTAGGDSIHGLGGADRLFGLAGDDCLFGGGGDDRLSGGPGNDRLSGAEGNDVLRGGRGTNAYSGGGGNDRLYTRDGSAQAVSCGSGTDTAWVDAGDTPRGCERVLRPRR